MIVWSVIKKLDKEVQERYPDLTEKEQVDLVWAAYEEIERQVLMGPSEYVGTTNIDFRDMPTTWYSYPGILSKYKAI